MVFGLWTGIFNTDSETKIEIEAKNIPKRDIYHSLIIDGVALAEYIIRNQNESNNYDIMNGGNYDLYALEMIRYFKILKSFNAQVEIALPLSRLIGNINQYETTVSNQIAKNALKNIQKINAEQSEYNDIKGIFPHFIFQLISETANKLKVPVIYTKYDVKRFIAKIVAVGDADACIVGDSDYLIFPAISVIPIYSFYQNDQGELMCTYLTNDTVAEHIGLSNKDKLIELSIIMGNLFTAQIMNDKYNIYTLLHSPPDPSYPALLMEAAVETINGEEEFSVDTFQPFSDIMIGDPEFKAAVDKTREYFDISGDLPSEGDSAIRIDTEKGKYPPWAPLVDEENDLWLEIFYDVYSHDVNTLKTMIPFRKAYFALLNRDTVTEHFIQNDGPSTRSIQWEQTVPVITETLFANEPDKYKILYQVVHKYFPAAPSIPDDPLNKIEEPIRTPALAIRFLLSTCFTDIQTPFTKTPQEKSDLQRDFNIQGAPCLDCFEFKALCSLAVCCSFLDLSNVKIPMTKPSPRKSHVSALYQSAVQHIVWLQQLLGLKKQLYEPERFFNGRLFSFIYDCGGNITNGNFSSCFGKELTKTLDIERVQPLIKCIMYAFPSEIFSAFQSVPRCLPVSSFQGTIKKRTIDLKTGEVKEIEIEVTDEKQSQPTNAPAPPVAPTLAPKKNKQKKKQGIDEEAEMAFLMEMAAKNEGGPKIVEAKKQTKPKAPPRRRVEKVDLNQLKQDFDQRKDGKLEAKRQLKQVFHSRAMED
ncbi:hypothetical protein TVAG_490220 [Trichomonas vaginalis G3]|uniref:XPG N-terminal domain containing protein n=1 Tax=Trichomonas vaginalis (strain ATCC PRA-98 / G3) TaxID=412133 RepID=A2F0V9_TRIV3|nr:asteroid protein family [Trichomonas vaginalis G3]EAY01434.1 hypothetical protein TVAG_490220 [Trichomonas vaginalis G3]KAI5519279.1 asteroid protein family [Trichomonas vaginalis G3]|eukprot:XP_001314138.1 hypothetical protein [Trichomonas vaginalis G3]